MKRILALLGLWVVGSCWAADVGIFADSLLLSYVYNVETGSYMSGVRALWNARGVTWHQTTVLSEEFLDTVDVLYLSHFKGPSITAPEQAALFQWVLDGGTLIFFGDCG